MIIDRLRARGLAAVCALSTFAALALASPVQAAPCQANSGSFENWLDGVRSEAAAAGVPQRAIEASLEGITPDPSVLSHDRGQKVFRQSFEQFSGRMVSSYRVTKGRQLLQKLAPLFSRIEAQYGVPGPILVAIWGLETDFGAVQGNFQTIRALATLAYDCRRPDKFRGELIDAMKIVARGDMVPGQMRGAWAGEIGQTQFLPSSYIKYAVDFDGDGRRDLIHSQGDVLASTANYMRGYGWQRGAGWNPGQPNFNVILEWNKSQVYAKTIAFFASKLAGEQ